MKPLEVTQSKLRAEVNARLQIHAMQRDRSALQGRQKHSDLNAAVVDALEWVLSLIDDADTYPPSAALRQRPQEERPEKFPDSAEELDALLRAKGDPLSLFIANRLRTLAKRPQAQEETPDLIALSERTINTLKVLADDRLTLVQCPRCDDFYRPDNQAAEHCDECPRLAAREVLSALRAQPATKVTIRHRKSPPFYATED